MREFAREVVHQRFDELGPHDRVRRLILQELCHQICRSDLFCSDPKCKKEIKSNPAFVTHLNKKHDVTDTCCKDLMRHFLEGLYPARLHIKLMTADGENADRQCDVERCPCLACDYFHDKDHSVEVHPRKHAER
jgi:hypothetical protein